MKSKTSFFDPTLLKKNISRFSPAWALLFVALFLAVPLPLMQRLSRTETEYNLFRARNYLESALPIGIVFAFVAGLLFAALVFKYLHRTNAAYMMHAFPMTRSCQFVTNVVSGLLFWVVPTLVIGLCTLGILTLFGVSGLGGAVWALLGKWLPSVNASNAETVANGKKIAKALGLRPAEYRKELSALRNRIQILENNLRLKDYSFDYAKVPSKAMLKYRAAFRRNDEKRYTDFLEEVET